MPEDKALETGAFFLRNRSFFPPRTSVAQFDSQTMSKGGTVWEYGGLRVISLYEIHLLEPLGPTLLVFGKWWESWICLFAGYLGRVTTLIWLGPLFLYNLWSRWIGRLPKWDLLLMDSIVLTYPFYFLFSQSFKTLNLKFQETLRSSPFGLLRYAVLCCVLLLGKSDHMPHRYQAGLPLSQTWEFYIL